MDKTLTLSDIMASIDPKFDPKGIEAKRCPTDQKATAGPSERTIRFLLQYAASFDRARSEFVGQISLYTN